MTHPDTAYYVEKIAAVQRRAEREFSIVHQSGDRRNVRSELVEVYRHLSECPKRHSDRKDLLYLNRCHENI